MPYNILEVREQIKTIALAAVGLLYVWGGRSWRCADDMHNNKLIGFDCYSFIELLYSAQGVSIPRNSRDQKHWVKELCFGAELQCGDVFFWRISSCLFIMLLCIWDTIHSLNVLVFGILERKALKMQVSFWLGVLTILMILAEELIS